MITRYEPSPHIHIYIHKHIRILSQNVFTFQARNTPKGDTSAEEAHLHTTTASGQNMRNHVLF